MIPKAFLSLAAEDADFVERVYRHLPHGQAFFFKRSFANGAFMLDAMEKEVSTSKLFVLFASKASLNKTWVKFEVAQARISSICGNTARFHIYPADTEVTAADLPEWMRAFWFDKKARNARDIARLISRELSALVGPLTERSFGRGQLEDSLRRQFNITRRALGGDKNPNIILASGVSQIGRETFLRMSLPKLFPGLPNIGKGPVFDLPTWADMRDIYRSVREIVEDPFDLEAYRNDLAIFEAMDESAQIEEITKSFAHFEDLGEAIILRAPSFLYDQVGKLRPWVRNWFSSLSKRPTLVFGIITNRLIPAEDLAFVTNACQLPVPPLEDDDVHLIIDELASEIGLPPQNPTRELLIQIGGHPVLARAYVRLAEQYGTQFFDRSPAKLYAIQDGILQDNLGADKINEHQKKILHVLSWLPKLDGYVLERICLENEGNREAYNESLNDLILGCLVEAKASAFSISGAVRSMFRRQFGYGPDALLERMASTLGTELKEADEKGTVRADLIDAIIFMHALTGTALPAQFRALLLPSTLETLVRDAYNSGREDDLSYDLAIKWGLIAEEMRMEEIVREEILGSVVRAYVRKEDFPEANRLLDKFDSRNYRSRYFLRGFSLMKEGKARDAISFLLAGTKERRYRAASINQLGIAYFQTGEMSKLEDLLKTSGTVVERSAFLLDLRAQLHTAENNYAAAERDIQALARLPEDRGRSRKRRALILAKRDRDYKGALRLLAGLIEHEKGRAIPLRFLKGIIAAKGADRETAMAEATFIRANAKKSGEKQYFRIVARLAIAEKDWKSALTAIDQLPEQHVPDRFMRADALRLKSDDGGVGLSEREKARQEADRIVGRSWSYTDLDFTDDD